MNDSVVIVVESLGGGGAQHVASTLANTWAKHGLNVTVITMQGEEHDAFALAPQVRRLTIGGSDVSRWFGAAIVANIRRIRSLRAALRRNQTRIVLSFVGSTNVLTVLAARGLGRRVIIAERNDPARQSLGTAWDLLRRLFYRRADLVVVNSRSAMETMAAFVPVAKMRWLPNPLRTSPPGVEGVAPARPPFFLAVGRLAPQKGFDTLLLAFADVAPTLPEWRLIILGDGKMRAELSRRADELGLSGRISFQGYVANPFPWYRAAAVLVHPARYEGMPNAVLEAMSEGVPVIVTTEQSGLNDIVTQGESGLVVPSSSVRALAAAMVQLAQDTALRDRIGKAARHKVAPFQAEQAIEAWNRAVFDRPHNK
jgi:GalNAc-alpha-(1->4)-GalNAc-alpha-(1->3)-diNAcBac-PP-undecaprenol alpha-1,4-N-acetyl-D-galactosaminyltransferase